MMLETEHTASANPLPKQRLFRVNFGTLPLIVIGFLLIIFALREAPWQPDYENVRRRGRVSSHWERGRGR